MSCRDLRIEILQMWYTYRKTIKENEYEDFGRS